MNLIATYICVRLLILKTYSMQCLQFQPALVCCLCLNLRPSVQDDEVIQCDKYVSNDHIAFICSSNRFRSKVLLFPPRVSFLILDLNQSQTYPPLKQYNVMFL